MTISSTEYLNIGCSPVDEKCVQVGEENYIARSLIECNLFMKAIRNKCGIEPRGARLVVKKFTHDFGPYHKVCVLYDEMSEEAVEYAIKVERDAPTTWEEGNINMEEVKTIYKGM